MAVSVPRSEERLNHRDHATTDLRIRVIPRHRPLPSRRNCGEVAWAPELPPVVPQDTIHVFVLSELDGSIKGHHVTYVRRLAPILLRDAANDLVWLNTHHTVVVTHNPAPTENRT